MISKPKRRFEFLLILLAGVTCRASSSSVDSATPCGNGVVGNGLCEDSCKCCSGWGWCDTQAAHCAAGTCFSSPDNSCTRPEAAFRGDDACRNDEGGTLNAAPTHTPTSVVPTSSAPTTNGPTKSITPAPATRLAPTTISSTPIETRVPTTTTTTPTPPPSGAAAAVEAVLESSKTGIDNNLFLYQTSAGHWAPSTVYRYDGFLAGLRVMYQRSVNGNFFYMGDDDDEDDNGHVYGLVNIALFLAQSMKETIQYNACDENSWDLLNGVYPKSNACGQLGQSYQDYHCEDQKEAHMECTVDPKMSTTATNRAEFSGAPGPLQCGPKTAIPPVAPNRNGRNDVEGCCWWGRGVIQTTGICNYGKLNYFLGKRAADEKRESQYPTIDFCQDPGAICANQEITELKWIAGLFFWMETVQRYDKDCWNYLTELHKFVDGGGVSDDNNNYGFVDAVSGIVNRGCPNPPCDGTGAVDGGADRREDFRKVLAEFG